MTITEARDALRDAGFCNINNGFSEVWIFNVKVRGPGYDAIDVIFIDLNDYTTYRERKKAVEAIITNAGFHKAMEVCP